MNSVRSIAIVVPSLRIGGMERVAIVLAQAFSEYDSVQVHLITFSNHDGGYRPPCGVVFHQPAFNTANLSLLKAFFKASLFIRSVLRRIKPEALISFGDRYNAFVLLAALGLRVKVFVSNRQNPLLSNGTFVDLMNQLLYPLSTGIVAQTTKARDIFKQKYQHNNIAVIPNPFDIGGYQATERKKIILNVGRFADQKNQHDLVRYFNQLETSGWELIFLGDGHKRHLTEQALRELKPGKKVELRGFVDDVAAYYSRASIFAFTSRSEGFPNVLGEAMAAGCACIAYDCIAGPADLLDDCINGFLIPDGDEGLYLQRLQQLICDAALREQFGVASREKMKQFAASVIARKYYEFITDEALLEPYQA